MVSSGLLADFLHGLFVAQVVSSHRSDKLTTKIEHISAFSRGEGIAEATER